MSEFESIENDKTDGEPAYVYCVVRNDMPPIHKAVQAGHACLEAGYDWPRAKDGYNTHLIMLGVDDKEALQKVIAGLEKEGINHSKFIEGYNDIGLTSIATAPINCNSSFTLASLDLLCV